MKDPSGEARRWLAEAHEDLRTVEVLIAGGRYAAACFHAHQAAEKAAKALRYGAGERFVVGHGVKSLLGEAGVRDVGLLDLAADLDPLYVPTRYPNGLPAGIPSEHYTESQARRAFAAARAIVEAAARIAG